MTGENLDTRLATGYENLRRREYELITHLLDLLPKIDNLKDEQVGQVRDALFHADHPFLMVFVGPFNSGKSSVINALLGQEELLPVGPIPTTERISILRWGEDSQRMDSGGEVETVFYPSSLLQRVSFVDTPGLESVFQKHEEITRKFLHRSDVVMLVMLATQAMTASNLEYLQSLKQYGKKVIILVNQVDLLSPEEAESVREYVLEQSNTRMGTRPEVWLVSAKRGLEAKQNLVDGQVDPAAWEASGLSQIETYIDKQLKDVDRLRQKLQTPLQITQNIHQVALTAVRSNQSALDHYQGIAANVEGQLAACKREQEKLVRDVNAEISDQFGAAAMQGSEAIRDIFQLSRAFGAVWRGLGELIGLTRLLHRANRPSHVRAAFERYKAFVPIDELPQVVDKLAPQLEGKDIQDIEDMVKYARREIAALPENIQSKVIGTVQPPVKYDRAALEDVRANLETLENEARVIETDSLEQTLRSTLLYLAFWEVLLVIFGIALINMWGAIGQANDQPQLPFILLILLVGLGLMGLAMMPLVGRWLETRYTNRMLKLQARYIDTLTEAVDKQIAYGMQLRRDAVAPLTRLIEAQTEIQTDQLNQLQIIEQEMVQIESDLTKLGKGNLLGLRG